MELLPGETLGNLGQFLTLKDMLALATSNKDFLEKILKPSMNQQLANYFGFPYGLTLVELKKYEELTLKEKIIAAIELGDERILGKIIQLYPDNLSQQLQTIQNFYEIVYAAAENGRIQLVDKLIYFLPIEQYANLVGKCLKENRDDILNIIVSAAKFANKNDEIESGLSQNLIYQKDSNIIDELLTLGAEPGVSAVVFAVESNRYDIIEKYFKSLGTRKLRSLSRRIPKNLLTSEQTERINEIMNKYI